MLKCCGCARADAHGTKKLQMYEGLSVQLLAWSAKYKLRVSAACLATDQADACVD